MSKNKELYLKLLNECGDIRQLMKKTTQHPSFLTYSDFNEICHKVMFENGLIPKQQYFTKIPGLEGECKKCWPFYLEPRNKSIKKYDIVYGRKYEEAFIRFLKKLSILSDKADKKNKVLPDNLILDSKKNILAYYEVKHHNAPFVWVFKKIVGRECYEGSITLDYEKVKKQIEEIRKITSLPVFYLHWVDFPCIKGVFFMTLEDTKKALEEGIAYSRKEREGDYVSSAKGKKKVGYQDKFYPSILKMKSLEDFVKLFI